MSQVSKTNQVLAKAESSGEVLKHACELLAMLVDKMDGMGKPKQPTLDIDMPKQSRVPVKQIVEVYNNTVQFLPKVRAAGSLEANIKARWKEHEPLRDIEKWRQIFIYCDSNNWLSNAGEHGWCASLRWIVQRKNMEKIINQEYDKHGFRQAYKPQTPAT